MARNIIYSHIFDVAIQINAYFSLSPSFITLYETSLVSMNYAIIDLTISLSSTFRQLTHPRQNPNLHILGA